MFAYTRRKKRRQGTRKRTKMKRDYGKEGIPKGENGGHRFKKSRGFENENKSVKKGRLKKGGAERNITGIKGSPASKTGVKVSKDERRSEKERSRR